MKTIEERAKAAITEYTKGDIQWYDEYEDGITIGKKIGFKDGYIQGATEQKAIDDELLKRAHKGVLDKAIKEKKELIDKACEWLKDNCSGLVSYSNASGSTTYPFIEDFRKAMEE